MKEEQDKKESSKTIIPFYRSGDYFFHRGLQAFHNKHLNRAARLFERAVKLTASEPVFKIQFAAVLTELGEYTRSNELLHSVLKQYEAKQSVCYFFIANNEVYLGHFYQAEKHVRIYLELEPNGQFAEEAQELLELFEDEPFLEGENEADSEQFLDEHERAWLMLRNGSIEEAALLLEAIVEKHPGSWAAQTHLAEALFRLGKEEAAFAHCYAVLEQDEGNLLAVCNLALFYLELGHANQIKHFRNMLKQVMPIDIDHLIRITEVLCALGAYEQVVARRLIATGTNDQDLLRCFGVAFYHVGDERKAIHYLNQAVSLGDARAEQLIIDIHQGNTNNVYFTLFDKKTGLSRTVDSTPESPLR